MRQVSVFITTVFATLGCASLIPEAGTAATKAASAPGRQSLAEHHAQGRTGTPARHKAVAELSGRRRVRGGSRHQATTVPAPRRPSRHTLRAAALEKDRAAAIAAVLASACQNTGLTPEPGNLGLVREAVLCLINRRRAQSGESPLRLNAELQQSAEGHAGELVADDYFAHVSPTGETPVDRDREAGYLSDPTAGFVVGENLAWGTYGLATPAAIVSAWIGSPGHLANMLESQYTETGIGVTAQVPPSLADAPGATYAQEFGVIVK